MVILNDELMLKSLPRFCKRFGRSLSDDQLTTLTRANLFGTYKAKFYSWYMQAKPVEKASVSSVFAPPRDVYYFRLSDKSFRILLTDVFGFELCFRDETTIACVGDITANLVFSFLCYSYLEAFAENPRNVSITRKSKPRKLVNKGSSSTIIDSKCINDGVPIKEIQPRIVTLHDIETMQYIDVAKKAGKLAFDFSNNYRFQRKIKTVTFDQKIFDACLQHAQNMALGKVAFGHSGFKKRAESLLPAKRVSENVAFITADTPESMARQTVDGWISSLGHRKNLESQADASAVAVFYQPSKNLYFFAQMFTLALD